MSKSAILVTEKIHKAYATPEGPISILKGIDFTLYEGDAAFIVGRSGSGKSTFLHLVGGLDRASEGRIFFRGNDLSQMNEKELAVYRNRKIGFVFQFFHLLPELTLFENVLLPTLISGSPNPGHARDLIRRAGLRGRENHFPSELSGGEQQRVAIARALVNHPEIILCDEPTGNLDDETSELIFDLLLSLRRERGLAFLIVTHDERRAGQFEKVYRLQDGVLVKEKDINPIDRKDFYGN